MREDRGASRIDARGQVVQHEVLDSLGQPLGDGAVGEDLDCGMLTTAAAGFQAIRATGSHPATEGTHLAACVFYATIFHQSPVGLTDHDGISDTEAARVQAAAATAVLGG